MRKKKTYGKSSFLLTVLLLVYIFPFFLVLINPSKAKEMWLRIRCRLLVKKAFVRKIIFLL